MGEFGVNNSANNFGASAGLLSNTFANRPAQAAEGTLFMATDTLIMYRYNSTDGIWQQIGGGGGSGFVYAINGLSPYNNETVALGGTLVNNTSIFSGDENYSFEFFKNGTNMPYFSLRPNENYYYIGHPEYGNNNFIELYDFADALTINFKTNFYIQCNQGCGLFASTIGSKTIIGDWANFVNGSIFGVDDVDETLIVNENLLVPYAGGNSGLHLKIKVGSQNYVISLNYA